MAARKNFSVTIQLRVTGFPCTPNFIEIEKYLKIGKLWQPFWKWSPRKYFCHRFRLLHNMFSSKAPLICWKICKNWFLRLCSIFSNGGHVFWRIKNSKNNFVHNTLRTNHTNLQNILLSSFREEDFQRCNIKNGKKTSKKGNNSHIAFWIFPKFDREVGLIILNKSFPLQMLAEPYHFWDICEKLHSEPPVLFLVTAAMFFDKSKIPTVILFTIP